MVGDGDLKLVLKDGTTQAINYKNSRDGINPALSTYCFSPPEKEDHQVYHHFCSKCGIHVFLTGESYNLRFCTLTYGTKRPRLTAIAGYLAFMGGSFNCANLRTLNLKEHGKDIRDYTGPAQVQYCDGLADTWAVRSGEPFPGGAW